MKPVRNVLASIISSGLFIETNVSDLDFARNLLHCAMILNYFFPDSSYLHKDISVEASLDCV